MRAPNARSTGRRRRTTAGTLALLLSLSGCGAVEPVEAFVPVTDEDRLFLALQLDARAVNLSTTAPYDGIQLTATPFSAAGTPMGGLPAAAFRSTDTAAVSVTADGLVTARQAAQGVFVIAELVTEENVRHADTAVVSVTADPAPPRLEGFAIRAEPAALAIPPSAGFCGLILEFAGVPLNTWMSVAATDAAGTEIGGLEVNYRSLDRDIATIDRRTGEARPLRPGTLDIVASTVAYGVEKADTVTLAVTMPVFQCLTLEAEPGEDVTVSLEDVSIRRDGYVFWFNTAERAVDLVFEGPAAPQEATVVCEALGPIVGPVYCGAGDVPAFWEPDDEFLLNIRVRRFTEPGTYTYRSTLTGLTGRIVVTDVPAAP